MSVWQRVQQEVGYWRRTDWSLGEVGAYFDGLAPDYDAINAHVHAYFRRFTDILPLAELPRQGYCLDVTARTGNGTLFFYGLGAIGQAVCADFSPAMGRICQQRLVTAVVPHRWVHLTSETWPFASGEFDWVLSLESVEHVARPERFVHELGRVLRRGGTLILSTPNVLWEPVHALAAITQLHHSEGPHRFIRTDRLQAMVRRAGLEVVHMATAVLIPAGPEWLLRWGEALEARTQHTLLPWLGLRRILICRKPL